jgi:ribosomal-protein-alanine N-acetyltransferase
MNLPEFEHEVNLAEIILETERLMLRRLRLEDAEALAELYADPETMRYFDGTRSLQQTRETIQRCLESYRSHGYSLWATLLKEDQRFIGRCGLLRQVIEGKPECEVAYMIARPYWNRGLGTEAARAIRDYGFRKYDFPRLISIIHPENLASQRVAVKNGMRYEKDIDFEGYPCRLYVTENPRTG